MLPCCCYREKQSRCVGRADGRDFLFEGEWEITLFARDAGALDGLFDAVDARLLAARFTRSSFKEEYSKQLRAHTLTAVYRCVHDSRNNIYQ